MLGQNGCLKNTRKLRGHFGELRECYVIITKIAWTVCGDTVHLMDSYGRGRAGQAVASG